MKRIVLALIVCPVVAAAQKPDRPWSFEVVTGLTAWPGRAMEMWSAISASATTCEPRTGPCTKDYWMTMADLTPGIAAARNAMVAGPFTSVRASAYIRGMQAAGLFGDGFLLTQAAGLFGGYVGVGYATPTSFGGLAFDIGVHGYVTELRRSSTLPPPPPPPGLRSRS